MKRRDRTGEYIAIDWEGGEAEIELVRGHVTREAFDAALLAEGARAEEIARVWHAWGRWSMTGDTWSGEGHQEFVECDGPGRGRFAVTIGVWPGFVRRYPERTKA